MALKFSSALLALYASVASAVNPVEVRGSDFVDTVTNDRFQIIGMAYQPGGSAGFDPETGKDPLSDRDICLRDAIIMQGLGINTIRVYNLSPEINHDACASIFNAAGIYMMLDVNSPLPHESLNAEEPWTTYHEGYLERVFQIVENFKAYDNLLGFFSANEVINNMETGEFTPQYIRAVTRDLKRYIANNAERPIPVGYSAADVREILLDSFQYMQCALEDEEDGMSKIDFYGINSYSWCGRTATYSTSGFSDLVDDFSQTTVPVFFSEYGCNEVDPRTWTEVGTIYGERMSAVFSGGIVYEYTQEDNDYGLVDINRNTLELLDDFEFLQDELSQIDVQALVRSNNTATELDPPACAASLIEDDDFQSNFTIPSVPEGVEDMIQNGVSGGHVGSPTAYTSPTAMPSKFTIESRSGRAITGLRLRILDSSQSNLPGNSSTIESDGEPTFLSGGNGAGSGSSNGGSSDDSAASGLTAQGSMVALAAGFLAMILM